MPELNPASAWHQEIFLALCSECAHRTLAVASPGIGAASECLEHSVYVSAFPGLWVDVED